MSGFDLVIRRGAHELALDRGDYKGRYRIVFTVAVIDFPGFL